MKAKNILTQALKQIGVEIGKDLIVHNEDFYPRVLRDHSLGLGEAYMEGWWDAPNLTALFRKIIAGLPELKKHLSWNLSILAYNISDLFLKKSH